MVLFLWYVFLILLFIYSLKSREGFSQGVQYIRIVNETKYYPNFIQIGEVRAFDKTGENVALGKRASSSGDYPGTASANVIDDDSKTAFYTANPPKTTDFWEVNLGKEYDLTRVEFHNRPDCCQERIIGCTMKLLNKNRKIVRQLEFTTNEMIQEFPLFSKESTPVVRNSARRL